MYVHVYVHKDAAAAKSPPAKRARVTGGDVD